MLPAARARAAARALAPLRPRALAARAARASRARPLDSGSAPGGLAAAAPAPRQAPPAPQKNSVSSVVADPLGDGLPDGLPGGLDDDHDADHDDASDDADSTRKLRVTAPVRLGRNRVGTVMMPKDLNDEHLALTVTKDMVKACKMILVSNLSHGHQTKYLTLLSQEAKAGETRVYPKSPFTLPFDQIMAPAYTAARMPILFGAADFVFRDIAKRLPGFQPKSILDFGTGPGTAIWAARKHFPASLHAAVGIDISAPMLEIAQRFAALPESGVKDFQAVRYLSPADSVPDEDKHDLVVAAFSLSELPSNAVRNEAIKTLWAQTRDMLVLIDRGTPDISRQIGHARQMILDLERATPDALPNAHLIAPCPHDKVCPLLEKNATWCHFSQSSHRNERVRDITRNLKNSKKDSEDIKFSYVVLRRGPRPPHVEPTPGVLASLHMHLEDWSEEDRVTLRGMSMDWPRLIAPPIKAKKKIILDLCTKDAQIHRIVCTKVASKRIGVPSYYSEARKVRWGDLWPHAPTSAVLIRAPIADKLRQEAEKRAERGQEPAGDNLDAAEASETDDVDDTDERGADEKGKRPKRDPLVPRERVSKGSARKEYKKWAEKANKIGA